MFIRKKVLVLALLCAVRAVLWPESPISSFTEERVEEFVTYRVALKSEDVGHALERMTELRDSVIAELPQHARDLEQETCILETMYFMEMYERLLSSSGNQKELRARMKSLMQRNVKCIESRKNAVSEWLYLFTGDATAYYMTRSVAATFLYGLRVKGFYESAIKANGRRAAAYVSLGNWCFYAPALFGGGKKKAGRCFDDALECAEIPGERYLAYIAVSQLGFERKRKDLAAEYLERALALDLGRRDLDLIARCNEKGYSYFQYLRDRSGIDEKMAEDEKDDDDK